MLDWAIMRLRNRIVRIISTLLKKCLLVGLSVFFLGGQLGYAWGQTGHRLIAALAERHAKPKTIDYIRQILDGGKLQDVSNWADEVRSENSPWSKSIEPWHYMTIKESISIVKPQAPRNTGGVVQWPQDIHQALYYIERAMQNPKTPLEQQRVLLALLVHMVADVHQPLHVGKGDDLGGNRCTVYWFRKGGWKSNLHKVWDSKMIDAQRLSYSEWADYLAPKHQKDWQKWREARIEDWIAESRALHPVIYPKLGEDEGYRYCQGGKLKTQDIPVLGYEYQYKMRPILEERLHQASVRLADRLDKLAQHQK